VGISLSGRDLRGIRAPQAALGYPSFFPPCPKRMGRRGETAVQKPFASTREMIAIAVPCATWAPTAPVLASKTLTQWGGRVGAAHRHTRDALAPRSRVSWRSAVFAALVLFALVTLVVKVRGTARCAAGCAAGRCHECNGSYATCPIQVLHAEDTHTRHEEMELARQNAVAAVVYSARREAQLSGLDSPHEANHASLSQPHATALEEASFTQPRAAAGAAARAQEAAAKAAVARVRDEQTTVGKATAAVRWQIGSPRTATTQPSPAEPEEAGAEVRVDSSGLGEQSRMETRSTTVDNLTLAIQAANLAPSGLPEVRGTALPDDEHAWPNHPELLMRCECSMLSVVEQLCMHAGLAGEVCRCSGTMVSPRRQRGCGRAAR
jgi:hypothetical protein